MGNGSLRVELDVKGATAEALENGERRKRRDVVATDYRRLANQRLVTGNAVVCCPP